MDILAYDPAALVAIANRLGTMVNDLNDERERFRNVPESMTYVCPSGDLFRRQLEGNRGEITSATVILQDLASFLRSEATRLAELRATALRRRRGAAEAGAGA